MKTQDRNETAVKAIKAMVKDKKYDQARGAITMAYTLEDLGTREMKELAAYVSEYQFMMEGDHNDSDNQVQVERDSQ